MRPMRALPLLTVACAVAAGTAAVPAHAQTKSVAYSATLAGLPVGSGTLVVDEANGAIRYRVEGGIGGMLGFGKFAATASTAKTDRAPTALRTSWSGLFGKGESSATLAGAAPTLRYAAAATSSSGRWDHVVRFDRGAAAVERTEVKEEPEAQRSPVTDSHRKDVVSPLHLLSQVMAADSAADIDRLCAGRSAVFTGLTRFDLEGLGRTAAGTPDNATRCRMRYVPVSGQRIDPGARPPETRVFEIDIVERDRRFLPVRIAFPSRLGAVVIAAQSVTNGAPATRAALD
jgi:hypothetical protein